MRNFQIKSIILGIGIGIVITSIISMIYAAGIDTNKGLSNEEIIAKAKALGMVDGTVLSGMQQNNGEEKNENGDVKIENTGSEGDKGKNEGDGDKKAEEPEKTVEKTEAEDEILISIKPGDTSEGVALKLEQNNLIPDKKKFIEKLTEMGLESKINVGEFKIGKGTGETDIIKMITGVK